MKREKSLVAVGILLLGLAHAGKAATLGLWLFDEGTDGSVCINNIGGGDQPRMMDYKNYLLKNFHQAAVGPFGSSTGVLSLPKDANTQYCAYQNNCPIDWTTKNGMTLEMWIKVTEPGVATMIPFACRNQGIIRLTWSSSLNGYTLTGFAHTAGGYQYQATPSNTVVQVGTWAHIAVTYDKTTVRVYLNGVQLTTKTATGAPAAMDNSANFTAFGCWTLAEWFYGQIDEVRLSDVALPPGSGSGVNELAWNASLAVPAHVATPVLSKVSGLAAFPIGVTVTCATPDATIYYTTDGNEPTTSSSTITSGSAVTVSSASTLKAKAFKSGLDPSTTAAATYIAGAQLLAAYDCDVTGATLANLIDITGNGHDATTYAANTTLSDDDPFTNVTSKSLRFPPGNTASSQNTLTNMSTMSFYPSGRSGYTLEGWVKYDSVSSSSTLVSVGLGGSYSVGVGFYNGQFIARQYVGTIRVAFSPTTLTVVPGTWYHLAAVFNLENDGLLRLYVNGSLTGIGYAVDTTNQTPSAGYIGTGSNMGYANGCADDIQISNYAKSPSELGYYTGTLTVANRVARPAISPSGGLFSLPTSATISCATSGAEIRYTLDGTEPNDNSALYGGPIAIASNMTLKAKAFKSSFSSSYSTAAYFTFPTTFNRPDNITVGSATVDGDLSEWSDATWVPLDKSYNGNPTLDFIEGSYTARWASDGRKLYVAVKVHDSDHRFEDNYTAWNVHDAVEIQVHTTSTGGTNYNAYQDTAQQYEIGIRSSDHNTVWTFFGSGVPLPETEGAVIAGREAGEWLYYEAALVPYDFFGGLMSPVQPNVISALHAGDVVGVDVCTVGCNASGYTGMMAENLMTGKYGDYTKIGIHKLVVPAYTATELAAVLAAMDARPGDGNWNVRMDLDGDGEVTTTDLSFVLANMQ